MASSRGTCQTRQIWAESPWGMLLKPTVVQSCHPVLPGAQPILAETRRGRKAWIHLALRNGVRGKAGLPGRHGRATGGVSEGADVFQTLGLSPEA